MQDLKVNEHRIQIRDVINALISLFRGNYLDAGLSTLPVIPIAGWATTIGKNAMHIADALGVAGRYGDDALDAAKIAGKYGDGLLEAVDNVLKYEDELLDGAADAGRAANEVIDASESMGDYVDEAAVAAQRAAEGAGDVKYYRVQTPGENGSMERIIVNDDGTIKITTQNASINLSYGTPEHAQYFKTLKGGDSYIVEFDVDDWFHNFVQENAIPQRNYRSNPLNQGLTAPKIVDETTPGNSSEFPSIWNEWFEEYAKNGRILK